MSNPNPISAPDIPNPSLYPHTSNGYLGVVTNSPAIYIKSLFTRELEWLEAACLSLSPTSHLAKLLNPLSRYELSGLCGKLDLAIKTSHPKLDFIEKVRKGKKGPQGKKRPPPCSLLTPKAPSTARFARRRVTAPGKLGFPTPLLTIY